MGVSIIDDGWLLPFVLIILGFFVGTYGSLIGVGGALVLVPALLFLYPDANPLAITAVSLTVVLINALGGTWAYARQKRIDYKNGLIFAAGTIPGVFLGILTLQYISRDIFSVIFGLAMVAIAAAIFFRAEPANKASAQNGSYNCNRPLGFALSVGAGFFAGLLGIGGGIIHVPVLVYVMCFPTHIATATSHFILVFTAAAGSLLHLGQGNFGAHWDMIFWLASGVVVGSQVGARLSQRLQGSTLIRLLAIALALTGIRLVFM